MRFSIFALLITGLLFTFPSIAEDQILQLQWSQDGNLLALATDSGVRLYDAELTLNQTILPDTFVASIDWHPNSSELAVVTSDHVEIWSRDNNNILTFSHSLETQEKPLAAFWNSDGTRLAALIGDVIQLTGSETPLIDGYYLARIVIWNSTSWQGVSETTRQYIIPYNQGDNLLAWHPSNPNIIAISGGQGFIVDNSFQYGVSLSVFILDSESGSIISHFPVQDYKIYSISWYPGGDKIIVGGEIGAGGYDLIGDEYQLTESTGGFLESNAFSQEWRLDGTYIMINTAIYANHISDPPLQRLLPPTRATWHPFNNTITAIVDGEPVAQDMSNLPGYILFGTNQP